MKEQDDWHLTEAITHALGRGDPFAAAVRATRMPMVITDPAAGKTHAADLIPKLVSCPVPEVARLGRTLTTWQREYLAYFDTDRTTNGPTEAVNLLIEKIRRVGHGYRNWHNYRLRLQLHCGIEWPTLFTPRIRRRRPRLVT